MIRFRRFLITINAVKTSTDAALLVVALLIVALLIVALLIVALLGRVIDCRDNFVSIVTGRDNIDQLARGDVLIV